MTVVKVIRVILVLMTQELVVVLHSRAMCQHTVSSV